MVPPAYMIYCIFFWVPSTLKKRIKRGKTNFLVEPPLKHSCGMDQTNLMSESLFNSDAGTLGSTRECRVQERLWLGKSTCTRRPCYPSWLWTGGLWPSATPCLSCWCSWLWRMRTVQFRQWRTARRKIVNCPHQPASTKNGDATGFSVL